MPLPSKPKLQGSYWTDSPTHGLPPLLGTGSVHVRVRCLTPAHASAKHSLQVPHALQFPCCTPYISHASLPSQPTLTSTAKERKQEKLAQCARNQVLQMHGFYLHGPSLWFQVRISTENATFKTNTRWQSNNVQGGEVGDLLTCAVFNSVLITTLTGRILTVLTGPHLTTTKITITLHTGFPWRPLNVLF